ncbi:DNA polymerase III subunit delta [Tengunoibacter tsumagoiensis]|uniref:DNA polymerase III subunit delta n=1 Tax=Tengunoibacter tsumagoiensis TaxID=2014871 RepID=A0A402A5H7_9CHLR|nr:DNA polymerase III subunit delta [Tengunoibacter tsumagoiensis]GCE14329.1 DNA polymerase III subunit delta [Tengunoibacter tsumagoiensis]
MFYLLHGEDEFTSREQLKQLKQLGDFGFNQDTFSGTDTDLKTILITCTTLPFLSEQRLVVVSGLPKKKRGETAKQADPVTENPAKEDMARPVKGKKGKKTSKTTALTRAGFEKDLAEMVATMPTETVLIVLVEEPLEASNPLVKAAEKYGKMYQSALPKGNALESWITKRAKSLEVKIASDANSLLANFIGNNLRLLANELDKLATYVGKGGTISIEDVRQLSAQVQEARIFDLTDALAQRNRKQALNILHDLLADGEPPLKLISTITTQVRSLMLVKELAQKGMRGPQIASTLGLAPFIAEKSLRQVGNFQPAQLENTYRQLLATDAALKRSRLTPEMALDLLVIQFGS